MTSKILHVSFDVWNTLVSANPAFAKARTEFLAQMLDLDLDVVKAAYTATKTHVDDLAEKFGIGLSSSAVYNDLFERLNVNPSAADRKYIIDGVHNLFLANPPSIDKWNRHLIQILDELHVPWSISSNSNFISGSVMFPFLQTELNSTAAGGQFSDLMQTAKPSSSFFYEVLQTALKRNYKIKAENILHVGDNIVCDGSGPAKLNIQHVIVKGPDEVFAAVLEHLQDH